MGIFGAVNVARLGRRLSGREKGMGRVWGHLNAPGQISQWEVLEVFTLITIFQGKKIPSIPVLVNLDLPAPPARTEQLGRDLGMGLSPAGTPRGASPGWNSTQKSPWGERGGFIPKNTTATPTPRGMENPISPSTLPNLP